MPVCPQIFLTGTNYFKTSQSLTVRWKMHPVIPWSCVCQLLVKALIRRLYDVFYKLSIHFLCQYFIALFCFSLFVLALCNLKKLCSSYTLQIFSLFCHFFKGTFATQKYVFFYGMKFMTFQSMASSPKRAFPYRDDQ